MIDLSSLNKYTETPDNFTISVIQNEINTLGLTEFLEYEFKSLDCKRVTNDGMRITQTIGYPYIKLVSEIIYIIDYIVPEEDKDTYRSRLLNVHNENIEYEKVNPPVWYGGEKAKKQFEKGRKTDRPKRTKASSEKKPKGPTAAERKLAAKAAKISALSFKIKSV